MRKKQASVFALAISDSSPLTLPGAPFFLGCSLCLAALWLAKRQFSARNITPQAPSRSEVAAGAPAG